MNSPSVTATAAAVVWGLAWAVLHVRWKDRTVDPGAVFAVTLLMIVLGLVARFPPFWALL